VKKILSIALCLCLTCLSLGAEESYAVGKKKKLKKLSKARSYRMQTVERSTLPGFNFNDLFSETVQSNILEEDLVINTDSLNDTQSVTGVNYFLNVQDEERYAQKLIAVQSTRSILSILRNSDIRYEYQDLESGIKNLTNLLSYSVFRTTKGLEVGTNKRGQEVVKLNLRFGLNRGADPQINFGDYCRVRYDWTKSSAMLEYGFNF
jgi:hypothetical protein